jgi:hypothetical protein
VKLSNFTVFQNSFTSNSFQIRILNDVSRRPDPAKSLECDQNRIRIKVLDPTGSGSTTLCAICIYRISCLDKKVMERCSLVSVVVHMGVPIVTEHQQLTGHWIRKVRIKKRKKFK